MGRRLSVARVLGALLYRGILPGLIIVSVAVAAESPPSARGVPFTRSYSLEDIGHVPRGSRLGFDRFGRVAVIHDAVYAVLNDSVWLNLAEPGGVARTSMNYVIQAPDGRSYYGARHSWGRVEIAKDGRLHPVPLVPAKPPNWVATASFRDLIATSDGVYFASWNGVAFWDFKRGRNLLFEVPRLSRIFKVGERVYISAFAHPLRYIDIEFGMLRTVAGTDLDRDVVEFSTSLDERRALLALLDGRLVTFDGERVQPWLSGQNRGLGDVSALQQLVDGRVAVAVTGQGLLLFSTAGEPLMALTSPQYRNIAALANREPGVLWVETEDAIEKILYGSPLSGFGQRLGLPITWPIVVSWRGQIYVSSDGKLYRAVTDAQGLATRFEPAPIQPPYGAWSLAAFGGERMLVGNDTGIYAAQADGTFQPVAAIDRLAHLVMVDESLCYAIGRGEIALLEWKDGRWGESVARIPGVRNPAVVHRVKDSAWIEMGGDGVARLWRNAAGLQLDVVPNETWTKGTWVNVGTVDDTVVLSAAREEPRRFFDQRTGSWCEAPELQALLERSPYWIARVQKDESGVIWATHNEGLVRFAPNGDGYTMDVNSFDLVNDRYPVVRIMPSGDVWVTAERSLYHIEPSWVSTPLRDPSPKLVSLINLQRNEEILTPEASVQSPLQLPFASNHLSFRFYSGTDAWRRVPRYEYRLSETEPWTVFDGSLLTFRGLREGKYRLEVRATATQADLGEVFRFDFEVLPPWHRSRPAYFAFGAAGLLLLAGLIRSASYIERRRNRTLEKVVQERTRQLEDTMAKLGEETRNAATLAERDRLANEIHDSVQQGLTGAILQLDSTLKLPAVNGDVRSRLGVVRNMVSYARQEVEHAVWDMESPLLDGAELADALRNLTAFINSGEVAVDVSVSGTPVPLGRTINHNLLRVAQEATTNAFRHAQARRITISLTYRAELLSLEIRDDGIGFRPGDVLREKRSHLGLRGMRARARKLGGKLVVESAPGQGTVIRVEVPVTATFAEVDNAEAHCS